MPGSGVFMVMCDDLQLATQILYAILVIFGTVKPIVFGSLNLY